MSRILLAAAFTALAASPASLGQTRPDFSGIWVLDSARSTLDEQDPDAAQTLSVVITQLGTQLHIDTIRGTYHDVVTYGVGEVPRDEAPGSRGVIVAWEGRSLRTMLSRMVSDSPVSILEDRRLSADGHEMVVQRRLAVEHGYQGQGVNTSLVVTDVYIRKEL